MSPDEEVNEFLERAIDARNVEQLKQQNVRPIMLKFYKPEFEAKVSLTLSLGSSLAYNIDMQVRTQLLHARLACKFDH